MSGTVNNCEYGVIKDKVMEKEDIKVEKRVTERIQEENRDRGE